MLCVIFLVTNTIPQKTIHKIDETNQKFRFTLEEENTIDVKQFLSWDNFNFVFNRNKSPIFKLLDPLLYAIIFILGTEVTRKDILSSVIELTHVSYGCIFIFFWFSMCVGMFPLVSNVPAEVANYRSHDIAGINHLYRPFYLLTLTGAILVILLT